MSLKVTAPNTHIPSCFAEQQRTIDQSSFDALSDSAFIREAQLVQSHKRPTHPTLLPFSAATLWRKVKAGTFCKPYKISNRVTAFKVGEVRAWMTAQTQALAQGASHDL